MTTTQSDLAGKLYKEFDPHEAAGTIPVMLEKWLTDNGIIVPLAFRPNYGAFPPGEPTSTDGQQAASP
jgi:hypothetical protein